MDFCFDRRLFKYINVNKFDATWVSKPDGYSVGFDKRSFKRNNKVSFRQFFNLDQKCFNMCFTSVSAPFMANHFLFHYEDKWIRQTETNRLKARWKV